MLPWESRGAARNAAASRATSEREQEGVLPKALCGAADKPGGLLGAAAGRGNI